MKNIGIREKTFLSMGAFALLFFGILAIGSTIREESLMVNLSNIFAPPGGEHIFGTDWVGRDMLVRTLKGMSLSIKIGLLCSVLQQHSCCILGHCRTTFGREGGCFISWLVDLVLSVPHTLIVILISIACGGGLKGIVIGVTATHWTSLTRVIRAEVMQIKEAEYTKISRKYWKK